MLCAIASPCCRWWSPSSSSALRHHASPSLSSSFTPNPRFSSSLFNFLRARSLSLSTAHAHLDDKSGNYSGARMEETVEAGSENLRLDSWITSHIAGISRARVQSSIRSGLATVNGRVVNQASYKIKAGDTINCSIPELKPLKAEPEDIPLDIVYEDDHLLVVNKPPHMVVHPAPGNATGTLVNGILNHCSLPEIVSQKQEISVAQEVLSDVEDLLDDELLNSFDTNQSSSGGLSSGTCMASVRPGIVHRLDKGTSGLLVVAKNEHAHSHLSEQFKLHTIQRIYVSLTTGVPCPFSGRIEIPIGRDPTSRIRMAAIPGSSNNGRTRYAASRYKVIEKLAGGASALVEWRLETGRTHQIRAHAQYMRFPLLGDEMYGWTNNGALSLLQPKTPSSCRRQLSQLFSRIERPCLHAFALGFEHPHTGENMHFTCQPPEDFAEILSKLRKTGKEKLQVKGI